MFHVKRPRAVLWKTPGKLWIRTLSGVVCTGGKPFSISGEVTDMGHQFTSPLLDPDHAHRGIDDPDAQVHDTRHGASLTPDHG